MNRLLPFIGYLIVLIVVFFPVLLPPEGKILFGPDITRYHYFQRPFLGEALREGQIPWWNPYVMMGVPYLEHPQVPVWYPFNLLFVLLPIHIAISWYIALHIWLAMAGMYVLVRYALCDTRYAQNHVSSASRINALTHQRIASWVAGVAFGLSAYFVARIPAGHIDIIAASAWMPWVIGAFWQLIQADRKKTSHGGKICGSAGAAGMVLAIQLLAGHPMVAVFTLEAVIIVTLSLCYFVKSFVPLFRAGLAVLTGLALAAIQLVPNAQYIARSIRTLPFPDSWAQLGTPTVGHMLEFLDPFYFYSRLPDSGFGFEHVGYIGKVPLLFAVIAVVGWIWTYAVTYRLSRHCEESSTKQSHMSMRSPRPAERGLAMTSLQVPMFLLIAIFGLWMWLGENAPVDLFSWVRSWFPLYSQIRIPARHVVLFVLSASVLFGLGLSRVTSKMVQLLVVALVLADLVPLARHHLTLVAVPQQGEDKELISVLIQDTSLSRFLPNFYHGDPLRDVLEFNAPIAHRIQSISGYDTPPLRNYYEFLLAVNGYQFSDVVQYSESIPPFRSIASPYLNFLNVKYILVPMGDDPFKTQQFILVKENVDRGWRLYENRDVFPRFSIATMMQKEPGRDAVLSAIRDGSVDPKTTIVVDGSTVDTSGFSPDCPPGASGEVRVDSYGYGKISLATRTPCNAFLATSEVMYPGWTATIDGKPEAVFEGNAAFRTLYVPRGTHAIVLSYRPAIVALGAAISIATFLLVATLLLLNPTPRVLL